MNTKKAAIYNNIVLSVPSNIGEIITKAREAAQVHQKEISDRLKMRGRAAICEYETETTVISEHTLSLMAIALNFHPNMPAKSRFGEELVFETNPTPEEGYSAFILNALKEKGMSLEDLAAITSAYAGGITLPELKVIIEAKPDESGKLPVPRAKHWVKIQLALDTYASGINVGEITKREREARGWSQQELAGILKMNKQTVSNYESRYAIPGNHIWALMMLALDIHPNYKLLKKDISEDWAEHLTILETV